MRAMAIKVQLKGGHNKKKKKKNPASFYFFSHFVYLAVFLFQFMKVNKNKCFSNPKAFFYHCNAL